MNWKSRSHKAALTYIEITILKVYLFSFCLHNGTSKSQSNSLTGSDEVNDSSRKKLRILIVDDDGDFRQSMLDMLEIIHKELVEAVESGALAIHRVKEGHSYDIIFLDINFDLEDMTGIEVYEELMKIRCDARIAMMSANEKSLNEAKDVLGKGIPYLDKSKLSETLEKLLLKTREERGFDE